MACFVRRVTIQENNIDVLVSRAGLRQVLSKGDAFVPTNLDRPQKPVHPDDVICLTIEAKLKRSGGEVHLEACLGSSTTPDQTGARAIAPVYVAFRALQGRRRPDCIFSELNTHPAYPLSTLRCVPRDTQRKTRGRADRYSFLVRNFHPLLHAGLSRRTVIA